MKIHERENLLKKNSWKRKPREGKKRNWKKIGGLRKSIKELDERESEAFEMLQSACAFLEEDNERMAKGVADKNMNEIEATQKIIELAQEKQKNSKKAKYELETVQKEKQKITNELEEKVVKKDKK